MSMDRYYPGVVEIPGVNITSHPRCGDTDRQRAADRVSEAYARGFLEKDEAEARHDAIGRATLGHHLTEITRDLPDITRWRGASLPSRTESRAKLALEWWNERQPWTGMAAILGSLIEGITPTVTLQALHGGAWTGVAAAVSVPVAIVCGLFGLISMIGTMMDV